MLNRRLLCLGMAQKPASHGGINDFKVFHIGLIVNKGTCAGFSFVAHFFLNCWLCEIGRQVDAQGNSPDYQHRAGRLL